MKCKKKKNIKNGSLSAALQNKPLSQHEYLSVVQEWLAMRLKAGKSKAILVDGHSG